MASNLVKTETAGAAPPAAASTPIDRILEAYELQLARLCGKPQNATKQVVRLRSFARANAWTDLRQVTTSSITTAMNQLASAGRKVNTIETLLGQLSAFFDWAVSEGHTSTNPVELVKRSKRKNRGSSKRRGARPLTDEEVGRLIAAAEADEASAKPRTLKVRSVLYRVARFTGARIGQLHQTKGKRILPGGGREEVLFGLRWRDVDLDAGTITFDSEDSKNGEGKALPLHPVAADALRAWRARCEVAGADDLVWPWKLQDRIIKGDLKAAGIPTRGPCGRTASFHSLRKSFAYGLVRSGVDVNVARRLLQHRTLEMTLLVYDEVRQEDLAAGLGKMFTPVSAPESKDLHDNRERRMNPSSLPGGGRTDSVSYLGSATLPITDPPTPPGFGAHAPDQGSDAPLRPGDAVGSLCEQLAAALEPGEGRSNRRSPRSGPSPAMPRGGLEPPLASPSGDRTWAQDLAGLLEAVAKLLRTGAAHASVRLEDRNPDSP